MLAFISFQKVFQMLKKELSQTFRDPKLRALIFFPPLLQLIIFGYAVNLDVENIKTAVIDKDRTPMSREFIETIKSNKYFKIVKYYESGEKIESDIDNGNIICAISIEKDFMKNIETGKTAVVQAIHDGTDSNTSTMVINYLNIIGMKYSKGVQQKKINAMNMKMAAAGGSLIKIGGIAAEPRTWFNETLESRNFFVPGIVGTIIMLVTLMLTSMAVVREKEIGTIEQLMVTPIKPIEIILGKTMPFVIIGLFQAFLIISVAYFWFNIEIKGSLLLLFAGILIFIINCLGIGVFISTISSTQQQAMLVTTFFFLPAMTLSGFMFPISNMPLFVQLFTYLIPLRYFLVIVRGIFLKGVGFEVLQEQYIGLSVLTIFIFIFAVKRFKKSID
ncbi:MAG: ABC transporter permease [Candidatus Wallbacteria bacterium]